jgi:acetylornithine deacetylase/succinyl-diaminopimelate desuccinylase-like protein
MSRKQSPRTDFTDLNAAERKLVKSIDEHEVIEYCKKLIATPSIFGSEHRIAEEIAHDLKDFGLDVTSVPVAECGPSVVAVGSNYSSVHESKGPHRNSAALILNGHVDTVQVCDGWKRDPFSPTVEGDRLYGLGSVDMKGGVAAMIMAAKALVASDLPLERDFAVHAVTDEEGWSTGTSTLIDQGFYDGAQCCIVGEPSDLSRLRNARRGRCLVDILVAGKSTHGAQPEHGINAILEAGKVLNALSKLPDKTHPRVLDFELKPLKSSSCVLKIDGGSDALSVPDKCIIRFDRHVLPGTSLIQELDEIKSYLKQNLDSDTFNRTRIQFSTRAKGTSNYEGYETDPKSDLIRVITTVSHNFGYNPPLVAGLSVADDCLIAARCKIPVVSYGPDADISTHSSGGAHESNEFVLTKQVVDAAKIYAITAYRILNQSES